jgi:hypothetical protein
MRAKKKRGWEVDLLVRCPCCGGEFETEDWVPFSPKKFDLHAHAGALLRELKRCVDVLERSDPPSGGRTASAIARAKKVMAQATGKEVS